MPDQDDSAAVKAWVVDYIQAAGKINSNPIQALLAMQDEFAYLPKAGLRALADVLGITPASIYGIATFYNQFRFVPPGRHALKVCMGTACHIKGGQFVLDHYKRKHHNNSLPLRIFFLGSLLCVSALIVPSHFHEAITIAGALVIAVSHGVNLKLGKVTA